MKLQIKSFLDSFGFQISRTPGRISRQIDFHKTAQPFFIDFMGPSGVGKTTLFNEVYKQRSKSLPWITPKEFLHNQNFSPSDTEIPFSYQKIIELKIDEIRNRKITAYEKLALLGFVSTIIKNEIQVKKRNQNQKVVFEDGFFHVFGYEIFDLLKEDFERNKIFIENRAIVLCTADPKIIAEQILKRSPVEGRRPQHKNLNKSELIQQQKQTIQERKDIALFLNKKGIPLLILNTAENLKENARKVNDFIKEL